MFRDGLAFIEVFIRLDYPIQNGSSVFTKGLRKNKLTFPMTIVTKYFSRSVFGYI